MIPGQPAVAGRNADRFRMREAENQLSGLRLEDMRRQQHSRSTSSLANMDLNMPHPFSAPPGSSGNFNNSRPSTPGALMLRSPQGVFPIVPNSPLHFATSNAAQLEGEVKFFRTLVEQGGKEGSHGQHD